MRKLANYCLWRQSMACSSSVAYWDYLYLRGVVQIEKGEIESVQSTVASLQSLGSNEIGVHLNCARLLARLASGVVWGYL